MGNSATFYDQNQDMNDVLKTQNTIVFGLKTGIHYSSFSIIYIIHKFIF
jgi:hypothetical protein